MKKSAKGNQIGVMSVVHEGRKPFGKQTYFFEDMVKSIGNDEDEIFFFSPMDWHNDISEISGYNFVENRWIEALSPIPKIIYDRAFSSHEDQKKHIEKVRKYLKESDCHILNPFELADLLNNKIDFHAFLQEHDIPTLGTYPFNVLRDSLFFDSMESSKLYVKPTFGSKGEGIFVIEKKEGKYFLCDHLGNKQTIQDYTQLIDKLAKEIQFPDRYFVQEAAKISLYQESPFDIRVLVQNYGNEYKVTGVAARIGQKKSITSNLNSGGDALPLDEMKQFFGTEYMYSIEELHLDIEKLCLGCSEILRNKIGNFCEIGFDILVTKDKGPIIIEGNAKPSRWVFVKIADYLKTVGKDDSYYLETRKETVGVPMKYATYLLRN